MDKQRNNSNDEVLKMGPAGAETLILLDDLAAGSETWKAVAGPLAEQFRTVNPGRSSVTADAGSSIEAQGHAAIAALDAEGCARAHIAGCGFGGAVALWLGIHHPERVSRLAVIGADTTKDSARWQALATQLRAGNGKQTSDTLISTWLTPELRERDPVLVEKLVAAVALHPPGELAKVCEDLAALDLRRDFGRIAAPLLLLYGEQDALAAAVTDDLLKEMPQAKLDRIPQAAHLVSIEQPARVTKALLDHFGSAANLEVGFRSRRVALGDAHVDKTIAAITPFTRSFQDFLTRYCWGEVWTRAGLSRRDRSLATISALVAIGAEHEIPVHVRAGLRHGLKIEEFPELYEQLALYTGLPRAFGALNITQRTLLEDGLLEAKAGS